MKVDGRKYPHPISHVNVRLNCDGEEEHFVGMTSDKSSGSYLKDFLLKGISLDTFLINVKGQFIEKEMALRWLPYLKHKGYVRTLKLLLNSGQCLRAQRYLRIYKELGQEKIYGGLRSHPFRGEGAGCAAFAVSFLQMLNLFPNELDQAWSRRLQVPLELLSFQSHRARIGFLGYLRGRDRPWAFPFEEQIQVRFWDPELMYNWVSQKTKKTTLEWDVRKYPVTQKPLFSHSRKTMETTVQYHLRNVGRKLSQEEVLNTSSRTCRLFKVCRSKAH
ncbi:hypothetical protein ACES2L_07800 [Bdellovibrio bacteriovorus]